MIFRSILIIGAFVFAGATQGAENANNSKYYDAKFAIQNKEGEVTLVTHSPYEVCAQSEYSLYKTVCTYEEGNSKSLRCSQVKTGKVWGKKLCDPDQINVFDNSRITEGMANLRIETIFSRKRLERELFEGRWRQIWWGDCECIPSNTGHKIYKISEGKNWFSEEFKK